MPPGDDNTKILIQIASDIGRQAEATENLKDTYNKVSEDIGEIKQQLAKTVTVPECQDKHRQVSHTIEILKNEIIMEIKKSGTGAGYQAITHQMLKAASAPTVSEIEQALEDRKAEKKVRSRKAFYYLVVIVSALSTMLVGISVFVYRAVLFGSKLEAAVSSGMDEVRAEIKNSKNKVYVVKATVPPGADVVIEPTDPLTITPTPPRKAPKKIK